MTLRVQLGLKQGDIFKCQFHLEAMTSSPKYCRIAPPVGLAVSNRCVQGCFPHCTIKPWLSSLSLPGNILRALLFIYFSPNNISLVLSALRPKVTLFFPETLKGTVSSSCYLNVVGLFV